MTRAYCFACRKDPELCIREGCANLARPCDCDAFAMKDRAGRVLYIDLRGAELAPRPAPPPKRRKGLPP